MNKNELCLKIAEEAGSQTHPKTYRFCMSSPPTAEGGRGFASG